MVGDKRTYPLSEKVFRTSLGLSMRIGSVFPDPDHRRTMQIIHFGERYKNGRRWMVDVEAVEIEKPRDAEAWWGPIR